MAVELRIEKVENGYLIVIAGDPSYIGRQHRYVFTEWVEAVDFISTLNDRLK